MFQASFCLAFKIISSNFVFLLLLVHQNDQNNYYYLDFKNTNSWSFHTPIWYPILPIHSTTLNFVLFSNEKKWSNFLLIAIVLQTGPLPFLITSTTTNENSQFELREEEGENIKIMLIDDGVKKNQTSCPFVFLTFLFFHKWNSNVVIFLCGCISIKKN